MNRSIEIGAMILGSASLLLVSFMGFAIMSGVPLNEVAVVGRFFPDTHISVPGDVPKAAPMDTTKSSPRPKGTGQGKPLDALVANSLGLMSAYSTPSPYTQTQLKELVGQIKARSARLEARSNELDQREASLNEREADNGQKLAALKDLQDHLDSLQKELLAREAEVDGKEETVRLKDNRKYAKIAGVLEGFKPQRRDQLLSQYEPDQAALILQSMTEDIRSKALAGLSELLPPEKVRAYVEAFSAVGGEKGR